jgi:hypothetical protein
MSGRWSGACGLSESVCGFKQAACSGKIASSAYIAGQVTLLMADILLFLTKPFLGRGREAALFIH